MPLALPDAQVFTGIDWACAAHAVCVMNAAGAELRLPGCGGSAAGTRWQNKMPNGCRWEPPATRG